ncbi:MAG: CPBP family glutamic-type intramembrane protease [Bacteroidia bacterium]
MQPITDKQRWFEISAVALTAIGKLVFMTWLPMRTVFIPVMILFWLGYIWYRARQNGGILHYWGFRKDNFAKVFKMLLPLAIVSVTAFIGVGIWQESMILSWHILPILAFYPIWGTIQQFLVVGLVAANLQNMENTQVSNPLIIILTSTLFGLVHYPHWLLVIGTFFLALVYVWVYLKEKNLFVLGLYHGWLGAFFFFFVLQRDAWLEFLEMIIQ